MKRVISLRLILSSVFFILFFAPAQRSVAHTTAPHTDTVIKVVHDTVYINRSYDWMEVFGFRVHDPDIDSIWGRPVSYYINDSSCSLLAVGFYHGDWRPGCNGMTSAMLDLSLTDNKKLRPFYRWCLGMTIRLSDGCLSEETGIPARRYAEKFPKEFFGYIDKDKSGKMYDKWVGEIAYSGYYGTEDYKTDVSKKMTNTMLQHCPNCSDQLRKRIQKFGKDCFQNPELMAK